ncbi:MAG: hypothetical protein DRP85_04365 [Candidatus Makaraimicrobium thalassicum]|nr:MAG: hypothetical protein DRP85_04365 [Candidatus Omnitrophota bacterium]
MKLIILTSRERLYRDEVKEAILPGRDGELSVWDFHQPFLCRLRRGYIEAVKPGAGSARPARLFLVKDGLAKMRGNVLTVLAEV